MIRVCGPSDFGAIHAIINEAAQAYKGVIPDDCWHEPYMSEAELNREIAAEIEFWGFEADSVPGGTLIGAMGSQPVRDVMLIRHAYVRPGHQRSGVGSALLAALYARTQLPVLIGTWAAAEWAVEFYRRHDFRVIRGAEKTRLLQTYWTVPPRQIDASVVLACPRWPT